jgi:hypothetical protein
MQTLKHSEAFRGQSGVFFLKSADSEVILTNLPVHQVSARLLQQARTLEGQALLALSMEEGHGLHFIEEKAREPGYLQGSDGSFGYTAEQFRATFLEPVLEDGITRALLRVDVDEWFKRQVNWRQSLRSAPGEGW